MDDEIEVQSTSLPELVAEPRGRTRPGLEPSARLQREFLLEVIENYLTYYASGDSHTARAKRYDLQHFLEFLAGSAARAAEVTVEEWTLQRTKDFVDDRLARGEAPSTVSRRLATIKHFGRTLAERVHGYVNPAREVKSPVIQPTKPHGLSAEEVSLLRQAAWLMSKEASHNFSSARNRTLLEMLLGTGLRADEVRVLICGQISSDGSWLKNVKTKGRKFRNVYVDSELRDILKGYLEEREHYLAAKFPAYVDLPQNERARFPVFLSSYHARLEEPKSFGLSPKSIWRIVSDFGKRARSLGTDAQTDAARIARLHPHKLRHTFAHGLLDSSRDVRLVAQALGHSDVRTTMRYTERTDEQVAAAIEQRKKQKEA